MKLLARLRRAWTAFFAPGPAPETEAERIRRSIKAGTCPDCGGRGWIKGPSAGIMTNVYCANAICGSRFNVGTIPGFSYAERIDAPRANAESIH